MNNSGGATIANASDGRSKRLACDRCRAQKLKCVRSEDSDVCQRCHAAKTQCNSGKPLPPGRPPTVRAVADDRPVNQEPIHASFTQAESRAPSLSIEVPFTHSGENNNNAELRPLAPAQKAFSTDASFSESAWTQVSNLDDDHMFMLYDDTVITDSSPFVNWGTGAANASSGQSMEHSNAVGGDPFHLGNTDVTAMPNSIMSPTSQAALDKSHQTADRTASPTSTRSVAQNLNTAMAKQRDSSIAMQRGPHLMQKLMHLGGVMCELQDMYTMEEDGHGLMKTSPDTFPTEIAGKVLQAAIEFRKSLSGFFTDDVPPPTSTFGKAPSAGPRGPLPPFTDDRSYHRPIYHYHHNRQNSFSDPLSRPLSACASSSASTSHASMAAPPPGWLPTGRRCFVPADKPTTLQLIANYLRLLQLYLVLYGAVHDYVGGTEPDLRHGRPIWGDLTVGGAPLYQFGDFQIKLVLQVAARLLEEIEAALGLVEGCRVSAKAAGEGSGILGMSNTAHFIEMCMSEVTGSEQGRGVIVRLRELMHSLSNMLDAPVRL